MNDRTFPGDMALTERFSGFTVASALANRATSDSGRAYLRYDDRVLAL